MRMTLPFTQQQFLAVFEEYNLAIWPAQVIFYLAGFFAVYLLFKPGVRRDKIISAVLLLMWLWNGAAYHLFFFSAINQAAYAFAVLFLIQAGLFFITGLLQGNLSFGRPQKAVSTVLGLAAVVYAMVVYPMLGALAGHAFPRAPMFGVAPCPTTIFTFGLFMLANPGIPKYLLAVPLVWSVIGFGAALNLGIAEDTGLLITGLTGAAVILGRELRRNAPERKRIVRPI